MDSFQHILLTSVFILLIQLNQSYAQTSGTYTAAVIALKVDESYVYPEYALDLSVAHYQNLVNYLMHNRTHRPDIIVFPEGGLHGQNDPHPFQIPPPDNATVPCLDMKYYKALRNLSCLAKDRQIYLVVNLAESYFNHTTNKTKIFNTNVVFDRKGAIVARYRKTNSHQNGYDAPGKPEISYFDTDFGVTFGVFTGTDVLFKEPLRTLIKDKDIKHLVHPTKWVNELPFFTGIQMQSGLTYSKKVVLLSASYNDPELGYSGTGIYGPFYHGYYGPISYSQPETSKAFALISHVPKKGFQETDLRLFVEPLDQIIKEECLSFEANLVKMEENLRKTYLAKNKPMKIIKPGNYLKIKQDNLKLYATKLIEPQLEAASEVTSLESGVKIKKIKGIAKMNELICTGKIKNKPKFCCKFEIEMSTTYLSDTSNFTNVVSGDNFTNYFYRLAVYDGSKLFPDQQNLKPINIQVCGIIPCLDRTVDSCGLRTDIHDAEKTTIAPPARVEQAGETYSQVKAKFKVIKIETDIQDSDADVYPIILLKSPKADEFGRLPDEGTFEFTNKDNSKVTLQTKKRVDDLGSIGILSSVYYKNDRSSSTRISLCYLLLVIPLILIHSKLSGF